MRNAFGLLYHSSSLHVRVTECISWGWTESSISLELTKTGASGEKLECYGSSVSHRIHTSRETQQSCQGSTPPSPPPLSLLHSSSNLMHPPLKMLFFAIIDSVRFLFSPIHYKAAYSFTYLLPLASFVWPQLAQCWTLLLPRRISDLINLTHIFAWRSEI